MRIKKSLTTAFIVIAIIANAFGQEYDPSPEIEDAATSFSGFGVPQNLGATVNSTVIDEHPVISPSGLSLYFSSDRAGGLGGRDIYVSRRASVNAVWGEAQNVAALNSTTNEAPGSISPNGREMFMNSARPGGSGSADLLVATRTDPNNDFSWSAPVNLGPIVNSSLGEQNPNYFVNPVNGLGTLYFSSDRSSGTVNVKDFYQSARAADGSFGAPSLIDELNSTGDEARTAIRNDGLEIFFSSTRLTNTTSQAMFVATRPSVTSPWTVPVALASINDGGNAGQPALSGDGTVLYFASGRSGGSGSNDLFSATRISIPIPTENVILRWNRVLKETISIPGQQPSTIFPVRSIAMVHAAMFDAVNSIDGTYTPYFTDVPGSGRASRDVAAAKAARDIMVILYPTRQAIFDAEFAQSLIGVSEGRAKNGIRVGEIVAARKNLIS